MVLVQLEDWQSTLMFVIIVSHEIRLMCGKFLKISIMRGGIIISDRPNFGIVGNQPNRTFRTFFGGNICKSSAEPNSRLIPTQRLKSTFKFFFYSIVNTIQCGYKIYQNWLLISTSAASCLYQNKNIFYSYEKKKSKSIKIEGKK